MERERKMIQNKLTKYMEETLFYQDLPGLALGISIGEDSENPFAGLRFEKTAGYKNFIKKEELLPEHIFHMASVTKTFVGTAVLLLQEQGKLSIEERLIDILPWFQVRDSRVSDIRVRHLLAHTAGLGDVEDYGWDRPETDEGALRRYVESEEVRESALLWGPEEGKFRYSNIGYETLGVIVAAVSGMSFEDYVAKNIFEPLNMKDTTLLTYERGGGKLDLETLSRAGMAMPHRKDDHKHIILEDQYPYNRAHGPSSTLTTNLADIAKWARVHLDKKMLREESYQQAWKPQALVPNNGEHIGLSWFIREQNGYTLYGHEGNDDGFRASFWICPELNLHIAVASNISGAPVKKINKSVFDILTDYHG